MSDFGTATAGLPVTDQVGRSEGRQAFAWGWARSAVLVEHAGVALVFVQLVCVAFVAQQADLLTPIGRRILDLAVGAFLVHHLLPARYRLKAFALLCGAALMHVMGASPFEFWDGAKGIEGGALALVAGGALAGICLLPIAFWMRAGLLGAAGLALAALRHGVVGSRTFAFVWPVLAGMVMFRIIVYFHQVSTLKQRPTLEQTAAYLFLLPNTFSGLFPVVDFKTFLRSHYSGEALAIYQRGLRWIVRGMVQLLCYRAVQLVALKPEDVSNGKELVQYILSNSFLYVRVSGQFHIFIGLLLLFGFNLPETNHRYFLASSFTDYWRRANIYWKDFIQNVFYYPTYFRLKRWPMTALVVATLWSFLVTWALHQYQTWWLQGSTTVTAQDALFWGVLGVLVLANSVWEIKRGRARKLASSSYTLRQAAGLVARTATTFACISVLWSLWSASSVSQWIGLWRFADLHTLAWGGAALVAIMLATVLFEIAPFGRPKITTPSAAGSPSALDFRTLARSTAPLVAIYVLSNPSFQARADYEFLQPVYDALNLGETTALVEGNGNYYERLIDQNQANVWEPTLLQRPVRVYRGADPIRRPEGLPIPRVPSERPPVGLRHRLCDEPLGHARPGSRGGEGAGHGAHRRRGRLARDGVGRARDRRVRDASRAPPERGAGRRAGRAIRGVELRRLQLQPARCARVAPRASRQVLSRHRPARHSQDRRRMERTRSGARGARAPVDHRAGPVADRA